jgi:hypothetical protein
VTSLWSRCDVSIVAVGHLACVALAAPLGGLSSGVYVRATATTIAAVLGMLISGRLRTFLGYTRMRRHGLLAALATMLPRSCAVSWLEEMQAQLDELHSLGRLKMLASLTVHSPALWWVSWVVHVRHSEALRFRRNEQRLVKRLREALEPRADLHISVATLEVLGMSRSKALRPTRTVPALATARRLLDIRTSEPCAIRGNVRELLLTRDRARRIARDLRRHHLAAWMRDHEDPYARQHEELTRLRADIVSRGAALRATLQDYGSDPSVIVATTTD